MTTLKSRNEVAVKKNYTDWDALIAGSSMESIETATLWALDLDKILGRTEENEADIALLQNWYDLRGHGVKVSSPICPIDKDFIKNLKAIIAKHGGAQWKKHDGSKKCPKDAEGRLVLTSLNFGEVEAFDSGDGISWSDVKQYLPIPEPKT